MRIRGRKGSLRVIRNRVVVCFGEEDVVVEVDTSTGHRERVGLRFFLWRVARKSRIVATNLALTEAGPFNM